MAGERRAGVSANRLLNGWKEIAAFFSKDERTVRRWAAAMDLPVHRVPGAKRAAVYAYAHDLERWLTKHREESNELFGTGEAGPPLETFDKTSAGGIVAGLPPDPARARRRPPKMPESPRSPTPERADTPFASISERVAGRGDRS